MAWKFIREYADYALSSGGHEEIDLVTEVSEYESFEEALKAHKEEMNYFLKNNKRFRGAKLITRVKFGDPETYYIVDPKKETEEKKVEQVIPPEIPKIQVDFDKEWGRLGLESISIFNNSRVVE